MENSFIKHFTKYPMAGEGTYKNKLLPRSQGIYVITYCDKVLYVGRTVNIQLRVAAHCANKLYRKEMRVAYILVSDKQLLKRTEKRFIAVLRPSLNHEWTYYHLYGDRDPTEANAFLDSLQTIR